MVYFSMCGRGNPKALTFTPRDPCVFPSFGDIRVGVCNESFLVHGVRRGGHGKFLNGTMLRKARFDVVVFEEERNISDYDRAKGFLSSNFGGVVCVKFGKRFRGIGLFKSLMFIGKKEVEFVCVFKAN